MAIYSLAQTGIGTTSGGIAMDILASASNSPRVMEWGVQIGSGTSSTYGLGRPSGTPTRTSPLNLLAENPSDPTSQTTSCIATSSPWTAPSAYFRRLVTPGTSGSGIVWTFPRGLVVAASAGLVLWNLASNATSSVAHVVVDE